MHFIVYRDLIHQKKNPRFTYEEMWFLCAARVDHAHNINIARVKSRY